MIRIPKNKRGVTLLEMMVVVAIVAAIGGGIAILLTKNIDYFQRMRVRQQTMSEGRRCMDTIEKIMRNGKARSLVISTPALGNMVPNSRADFVLQTPLSTGTTAYSFYLENNKAYAMEYHPTATRTPKVLASNVSALMFTCDSKDPANISVTLRIDAHLDARRWPDRVFTYIMPNQAIPMVETP